MEALHRFNLDVVIPNRHRIQRLRTDKGGEFIKVAFSKICQTIGVRLEFATTVTPQKIGVTERDGRPLMEKTRCFIRYGRFLKYIWGGEMMLTATYLANRSLHAALGAKLRT